MKSQSRKPSEARIVDVKIRFRWGRLRLVVLFQNREPECLRAGNKTQVRLNARSSRPDPPASFVALIVSKSIVRIFPRGGAARARSFSPEERRFGVWGVV